MHGNSPHWQERSICQTLEWHGLTVEVIGEENWLPGTTCGGIDIHSVVVIRDVKDEPCMVDLTELVGHFGTEELEEMLGAPKRLKVTVCHRPNCLDRTFRQVLHNAPQPSVGPMAERKVG